MGFLRCNLAPRHTKEVAYKTSVRPQLEYAAPTWHSYHKTQIGQVEKVQRTGGPAGEGGPAGNGETPVALAICWTNLSGHPWRPTGSSPPLLSSTRFTPVQCLFRKNKYLTPAPILRRTMAHESHYTRCLAYSNALNFPRTIPR